MNRLFFTAAFMNYRIRCFLLTLFILAVFAYVGASSFWPAPEAKVSLRIDHLAPPTAILPQANAPRIGSVNSFRIAFKILARDDYYDNLLQTSDVQGFRLELRHPRELYLVFSSNEILLSDSFSTAEWHSIEIHFDESKGLSATLDGKFVFHRTTNDLSRHDLSFDELIAGTGFNRKRTLQGEIKDFFFEAEYRPITKASQAVKVVSAVAAVLSLIGLLWRRPLGAKLPDRAWGWWLAPLLTVCPVLVYQLSYFNAFYPVTEGWFSVYAHLINLGDAPYRHFELLIPPAYPYSVALLQDLFGSSIIALRTVGVALMCGISIALFFILQSGFNRYIAAITATYGTIYYQNGNAFINYDYTQVVTFFMLSGAALLIGYAKALFSPSQAPEKLRLMCFFAGAMLALAVLTKHSNATVCTATLGLGMLLVMARAGDFSSRLKEIAAGCLGFASPLLIILITLWYQDTLPLFFAQVFSDAAAAKGGVAGILSNAPRSFYRGLSADLIFDLFEHSGKVLLATCLVGCIVLSLERILYRRQIRFHWSDWYPHHTSRDPLTVNLALAAATMLAMCIWVERSGLCHDCFKFVNIDTWVQGDSIPASILLTAFGMVISLPIFMYRPSSTSAFWLVVSIFGIGLAWGNGTSAGFSEVGAFLGVSLAVGAALTVGRGLSLPSVISLTLIISASDYLIDKKYARPYDWWGVSTASVRGTSCGETSGILEGMCIPKDTLSRIEDITSSIISNSSPEDAVYIYPHIPIFYLLSNRRPYHGAVVSWPDFMSMGAALSVTSELLNSPPKVLVVAELAPGVLETHERLFRNGAPSPQRAILAAIETLKNDDVVEQVQNISDINGLTISVYRLKHTIDGGHIPIESRGRD